MKILGAFVLICVVYGLIREFGLGFFAIVAVVVLFRIGKKKSPSASTEEGPKPKAPLEKNLSDKQRAQKLLEMAKYHADELNASTDVFSFTYEYQKVKDILQDLILLNEELNVFMHPTPRENLQAIKSNMEATINDFISRAMDEILGTGEEWADEVGALLDEIENDGLLSKLLKPGNRERIAQIRKRAQQERAQEQETEEIPAPIEPPPSIDYEQILKEEADWRREQAGISRVKYEPERIDGMDGHTFEHWCAALLKISGFKDVEVTRKSGDQGVDVLATLDGVRYAVQCKCYSSDLGNKPVQEIYAGIALYHCQMGSVMTNRYFTAGAKELAQATGIALWDRDWITSLLQELEEYDFPIQLSDT